MQLINNDLEELKTGKKNIHNLEYRWLDKFGNPIWISCRGVIINDNDKPRYMIGRISELGRQNRIDKVTGLYQSGVLKDKLDFINKKLSNPGFVNKAPEKVVEQNRADASKLEEKIANIKNSIENLGK